MTLFPGISGYTISDDELKLLYAMVRKIKVSPVKLLVNFWLSYIEYNKPIYFTSFITRIAETFGLLDTHTFEHIDHARDVLGEEFFISINVLKKGPRGGLRMIYPGHTVEVPLPCEKRRLYALRTLTIKMDRVARDQTVAGTSRVTRGMSRAAQLEQGGPSHPVEDVEEGDEASSMDISESMEEPPHPQRAPRPRGRGRRQPRTEMDELIDNMGNMQIEQEATLQLAQQNAQLLQAIREEDAQHWAGWFQHYPPPQ